MDNIFNEEENKMNKTNELNECKGAECVKDKHELLYDAIEDIKRIRNRLSVLISRINGGKESTEHLNPSMGDVTLENLLDFGSDFIDQYCNQCHELIGDIEVLLYGNQK